MTDPIFDIDRDSFIFPLSDDMGMDEDGNLLMRLDNDTAMELDTGDLHFTSGWNEEDC